MREKGQDARECGTAYTERLSPGKSDYLGQFHSVYMAWWGIIAMKVLNWWKQGM